MIAEGVLDEMGVEELARHLHISTRQLRRSFVHELGAPPVAIAQTRRLLFAKKLIDETTLPMADVALSAGYASIRRFNDALRQTYGRTPTALRQSRRNASVKGDNACVQLKLFYRLPYDWCAIMHFLHVRAISGVETVSSESYRRTVQFGDTAGVIEVRPVPGERYCLVRTPLALSRYLLPITERIKRLFDLKADPATIATHLSMDERLSAAVRASPGLRLPGAWDGFEMAVRTILEQQDSVQRATALCRRLVGRCGEPLSTSDDPRLSHVFPSPQRLATAPLSDIGLTPGQAETIRTLAAAVANGHWALGSAASLTEAIAQLTAHAGIGVWAANMIAMRALGEPDAFPARDLTLRRVAATNGAVPLTDAQLLEQAEAWRPWRAYAAMYLWTKAQSSTLVSATTENASAPSTPR
jgi:AraC family transcriptional regulator of adaptative response / DNA-3-methyladenine glycosylase II